MARTFIQQETQIRNTPAAEYLSNIAPSLANYQTSPTNIQEDLNNVRSQLNNLLQNFVGNWYDDLNTPITFEFGAQRGVNDLNTDLHDLERKRVLVQVSNLTDVTVGAADNFKILSLGELPSNTTQAVGVSTTLGTVAAFNAGFGANSLALVAGTTAISPKNLCEIVDGSTRDQILSSGRVVWALFQVETATDGITMTGTTPNRAQLSFVRINATGDALEACPAVDIQGKTINYASVERKGLESLNEQDFLRGAILDIPAGTTVTRQVAYDNQGTTPVEVITNSILDLNSAGLNWDIRDLLNAVLFRVTEGSTGGTSTVQLGTDVDTFDVNAVLNDFLNGAAFDTGAAGTTINVGVTANQIDAGGVLKVTSGGAADLSLAGALELNLTDSYRAGSSWGAVDGIALAYNSGEWSAFETAYGSEVSLLGALTIAVGTGARGTKTYANVTVAALAGTDVGGVAGGANLDAQLPNMSTGTFLIDYDVYLNGALLRPEAAYPGANDYGPGTSLANGQLKFEFKVKVADVICVIPWS